MFASTPERPRALAPLEFPNRPAANSSGVQLPPLSSMLADEMSTSTSTPLRPSLPALSSFNTPQTPRYMLPSIRSASTPALATLPELSSTTSPEFPVPSRILGGFGSPEARTRLFHSPNGILGGSGASGVSGPSVSSGPSGPASNPLLEEKQSPNQKLPTAAMETPEATRTSPNVSLANVSVDSEVDDSMIKTTAKRKHGAPSPSRDFAFISHSPATYPSQEPSIDNAWLARRKRRRTSPVELAILNDEFKVGSTPDKARRVEIAEKVNMTEKAVQIWFQNKRQSLRRLKNSEKEVTELPPTPDSSLMPAAHVAAVPFYASTPLRPALAKSETAPFVVSPAMAQSSPIRSSSTSDLTETRSAGPDHSALSKSSAVVNSTLYSKMLATSRDGGSDKRASTESSELVMNLTNKKQPGFARKSAHAATQVRTFKLTPKDRKPLSNVNTNTQHHSKVHTANDSQCVQSLLSLKVGHL